MERRDFFRRALGAVASLPFLQNVKGQGVGGVAAELKSFTFEPCELRGALGTDGILTNCVLEQVYDPGNFEVDPDIEDVPCGEATLATTATDPLLVTVTYVCMGKFDA